MRATFGGATMSSLGIVDRVGALLIDFDAVWNRAVIGIGIQRIGSDLVDFLTVTQPVTIGVRVVRIGFTRTCGSCSANRSRRSPVSVRVFLAIGQSITIGVGIERIGRGTRVSIGSEAQRSAEGVRSSSTRADADFGTVLDTIIVGVLIEWIGSTSQLIGVA